VLRGILVVCVCNWEQDFLWLGLTDPFWRESEDD